MSLTMDTSMNSESPASLKRRVARFWSEAPCGTAAVKADTKPRSREYYQQIEDYRYLMEPEIFGFAQFTRHTGQKMLEVGVGTGTDFAQWVRAGAEAYGIDLTLEGIKHARRRMQAYGLEPKALLVADAEALPFSDESFELVYSWGVIHHTPRTEFALSEIVRVMRNDGVGKIMVYHRDSLQTFLLWVRFGLLLGRPWRTRDEILWNYQESAGTKAFSKRQVQHMLDPHPVRRRGMHSPIAKWEMLIDMNKPLWKRVIMNVLGRIAGPQTAGWWLMIQFDKHSSDG